MADDDRDAAVDREIQQAQQALDDAAKAQDADLSDAAVINRLYYAAFHSVQAVLYDREFDPTSHGGVLSLFGSEVIAVGDASRDDGRFFSQLSELRQQADYGTMNLMRTLALFTPEHRTSLPRWNPLVPHLID
ncbi:HEPN domain-containing protein [Halococcus sp. IIIV-5B]|uniref:HEPN domain-containing protein n=1 Tax=Halococcus sp. IIIV-5B TaxID=2321230 RepID=UPI001F387E93|nr:HEPN domain-containing protein [Halococcus sp. IIIV-5B]